MSKRFHINAKGVPEVCKAKKGRCSISDSSSHFYSWAEALMWAENSEKRKNSKENIIYHKSKLAVTKEAEKYVKNQLKKIFEQDKNNDRYIERCKSSKRIFNFKPSKGETFHFMSDRKEREEGLCETFGEAKRIGFYKVNHLVDGEYRDQVVELFDNGKMKIYDVKTRLLITTFIAHRQRIEVMMLKAGEIPDASFLHKVKQNRKVAFAKNLSS